MSDLDDLFGITFDIPYPSIEYVKTGFYSLDWAMRNISYTGEKDKAGIPMRTMYEVYGPTSTFKSTFCLSVAGQIAKRLDKGISFLDLEGAKKTYVASILHTQGFKGNINLYFPETDEGGLTHLSDTIRDKKEPYSVFILDSVGAISPLGEQEGEVGERNMGQRAFSMAQFSRRSIHYMLQRKSPAILFITNHQHDKMGGGAFSSKITAGGETKYYLSAQRIYLQRVRPLLSDGSLVIRGTLNKNRWAEHKAQFEMFYLAGRGFHVGMSAVNDCLKLGLAEGRKEGKSKHIYLDEKDCGTLKDLLNSAKEEKDDVFKPFKDKIETKGYSYDE